MENTLKRSILAAINKKKDHENKSSDYCRTSIR